LNNHKKVTLNSLHFQKGVYLNFFTITFPFSAENFTLALLLSDSVASRSRYCLLAVSPLYGEVNPPCARTGCAAVPGKISSLFGIVYVSFSLPPYLTLLLNERVVVEVGVERGWNGMGVGVERGCNGMGVGVGGSMEDL
jgi:hypothetical protein